MVSERAPAAFWFDNRRDRSAFVDIPLPRAERTPLHRAPQAGRVPIRHESSGVREFALLGVLVLSLSSLVIARIALKVSAVAIINAPATSAMVIAVGILVWTRRRTR